MGAFQDIRAQAETARQAQWGETVTFGMLSAGCEATPEVERLVLERGTMMPRATRTITVTDADYQTFKNAGLVLRSEVQLSSVAYLVYEINQSDIDPSVDLRVFLKV